MRAVLFALLAIFPALSTFALPISDGNIVRGKYSASGHVSAAGIKVTYGPSNVHINNHGKVSGRVVRTATYRGVVLESSAVRIRGNLQTMHIKRGAFTANAVLHIADGTNIRGVFQGLVDPSQKLSRFFKGKITGNKGSNFKLRAR